MADRAPGLAGFVLVEHIRHRADVSPPAVVQLPVNDINGPQVRKDMVGLGHRGVQIEMPAIDPRDGQS